MSAQERMVPRSVWCDVAFCSQPSLHWPSLHRDPAAPSDVVPPVRAPGVRALLVQGRPQLMGSARAQDGAHCSVCAQANVFPLLGVPYAELSHDVRCGLRQTRKLLGPAAAGVVLLKRYGVHAAVRPAPDMQLRAAHGQWRCAEAWAASRRGAGLHAVQRWGSLGAVGVRKLRRACRMSTDVLCAAWVETC